MPERVRDQRTRLADHPSQIIGPSSSVRPNQGLRSEPCLAFFMRNSPMGKNNKEDEGAEYGKLPTGKFRENQTEPRIPDCQRIYEGRKAFSCEERIYGIPIQSPYEREKNEDIENDNRFLVGRRHVFDIRILDYPYDQKHK